MTAVQQADAVSALLMTQFLSGAVFYGLIFVGLCLIAKQIARVL